MGNVHGVDGPEAMCPPISNVLQASLHGGEAEWGGSTVDPKGVGNTPVTKGGTPLLSPCWLGERLGTTLPLLSHHSLTISLASKEGHNFFLFSGLQSGKLIQEGSFDLGVRDV